MWDVLNRFQRGFSLPGVRHGRLGVTGVVSVVALVLIFVAGAILDMRADRAGEGRFAEAVEREKVEPVRAIVDAGRAHRIVFLSDIHASADTKRLAANAIEALANGPGLDAVVVEVASSLQPYIDRYLDTTPEDASILLARPGTMREPGPASRDFLEIYHRVWVVNQKLGADRRIHILAIDAPDWPPQRAVSPSQLARLFAKRTEPMIQQLDRELLAMNPRARMLIFTSGWHALRGVHGVLQTGGTAPLQVTWLAQVLAERFPGEVFSFIVDAPVAGRTSDPVAYRGTRIPEIVKEGMPSGRFAVRTSDVFGFLKDPFREPGSPGLTFELEPRNYRLQNVADAYIYLGN